jgi:tripeptide aminopeptidase
LLGSPGPMLTPDAPVEQLFCELVAIPSPSGRERAVGEAVRAWLAGAGVEAAFDGAGAVNGSDAGNLLAVVPGGAAAPVLLFVAHLDTVETGEEAVAPVLGADDVIRSAGATILGADNKSAVAALMRACARTAGLAPEGRPTVLAAFTCREEAGRMGVSLLELPAGRPVDCAFSVDGAAPIGTAITRALGQQVFTVLIRGRAAHAAADPDAGVSAIRVAAEAVSAMALGRLPGGGSASIAALLGGAVIGRLDGPGAAAARAAIDATPTNSVPDLALLRGEVRGYTAGEIAGARRALQDAVARACADHGAEYEWVDRETAVPPFPGAPDSQALALARAACARAGLSLRIAEAHATLEANYLAADLDVVALASGGAGAHQPDESIAVRELRELERLLNAIVDEAVASPSAAVSLR